MRAFIAAQLPPAIKECLSETQNQLKTSGADVKWVEKENIHLTLKFLGNIDQDSTPPIKEVLNSTAKEFIDFTFRISNIGAFPGLDHPRVIYAGIDEGADKIKELIISLENKLLKIGIPKEDKDPVPHITIGRVRSFHNISSLKKQITGINPQQKAIIQKIALKEIFLFKSELSSAGPLYEAIEGATLKSR
ncbi:MAG: RNA 2',3'-cyclic phosphodiesterase [Candidatus Omnitrophota bacterium]|jgi:2'-5' RNA ligase|nr:MAG: RNA 2',3'-cyclic phosphodiesterase [Candidatus Omnitrophota bacterium]